ncbi:hypothetical protein BH09MYX1_BH09MYX1_60800 [soil metagenome]
MRRPSGFCVLAVAAFVASCRAPTPTAPSRHPAASAVARIDAELAQSAKVPFSRIEVVIAFDSSAPTPMVQNPQRGGLASRDDHMIAQRVLVADDLAIDGDAVARRVGSCLPNGNAPAFAAVTFSDPPLVTPLATLPNDADRCVAAALPSALAKPSYLRYEARLAILRIESTSQRGMTMIDDDLAEIDRRLANEQDRARRVPLLVLAGSFHAERALTSDRAAELERARHRYDEALAITVTPAALFGSASAHVDHPDARALAAFRALVCPSRFGDATTTPGDPGHPRTLDRARYDDCVPMAGAEPAWVAEAWRAVGHDHANRDPSIDPFALVDALTAYGKSLAAAESPFVRLELGRVLHRQQRFHEATRVLRVLLDSLEGDRRPIADLLRVRASQVYGSALTFADFEGPAASAPFTDRLAAIDTEPKPERAAAKLAIVLDRLADPTLVSPSASYAPLVVLWASWELSQIAMFALAVHGLETFLARWPLHPDAPVAAWERVHALDLASMGFRAGTPEAIAAAKRAAAARAELLRYRDGSAWAAANVRDAVALSRGERIAR